MGCQHSSDDQTLRLQAGTGEDDFIHLPSGPDRVECECQEEEEEGITETSNTTKTCASFVASLFLLQLCFGCTLKENPPFLSSSKIFAFSIWIVFEAQLVFVKRSPTLLYTPPPPPLSPTFTPCYMNWLSQLQ